MWVLYELERSSGAYNVPHIQWLKGTLDSEALVKAVRAAAGKHEVLRMQYGSDEQGRLFQSAVALEEWVLPVREVWVQSEVEAMQEVNTETGRAMGLEVSSVRLAVVHVGSEEHVVVLTVHHIATDGWSTAYLMGDVEAAYNALARGEEVQIGETTGLRYTDYAAWQREMLADTTMLEPHMEYWREALGGELPVLELQTDRPRPAVLTSHGGAVEVCVGGEAGGQMQALCRECGVTMMRGMLAAWAVTLGKHSGQGEVVVGTPYANREHGALHAVVGYFVNVLAVRLSVKGSQSVREVVKHASSVLSGALAHAVVPWLMVVEAVAPVRDASRTPVFQTMLVWEEAAGWGNANRGGALVGLEPTPGTRGKLIQNAMFTSKFEIQMSVTDCDGMAGRLGGELLFNSDLYHQSTMARIAAAFALMVARMGARPDAKLTEVEAMASHERQVVLEEWNETAQPYPDSATAHSLFEAQAMVAPAAVAVVFEGREVSYAELMATTGGLAGRLQESGVGAEEVVGLCVEKSVEEVAGMVGIMRAGAAYVPLDPKLPVGRLQYLVEQCGAAWVVAQEASVGIPCGSLVVQGVVVAEQVLSREVHRVPVAGGCGGESVAYVMFTSGSTGKPKGVMVVHESLSSFLQHENTDGPYRPLQCEHNYRRLYVIAITFDVSVGVVWRTLVCGSQLVIGKPDGWLDPHGIVELLARHRVTSLWGVPSPFSLVMDAAEGQLPPSLTDLHLSGEVSGLTA